MEAHLALASALAAEAAHSAEDAPAPAPAAAAPPPPPADSLGADAPDGPPPLLASATGESAPLFSGPGGAELARLLEGLWQSLGQDRARDLPAAWYPAAFRALLAEHAWRPPWGDARLAVLGPMEARLLSAELVVLGALNEGAWPRQPDLGPWMGRKMRRDLSLAPPELRIGQAARDFAESCAAPRVVLTWAERREGAPAQPSRWILRLRALAALLENEGGEREGREESEASEKREESREGQGVEPSGKVRKRTPKGAPSALHDLEPLLGAESGPWRGETAPPAPPKAPLITHPEDLPARLSVTAFEALRRNPYEFFARQILGLREAPSPSPVLDPAAWGSYLHELAARLAEDEEIARLLARPPAAPGEEPALPAARALAARIADERPQLREALRARFALAEPVLAGLLAELRALAASNGAIAAEVALSAPLAAGEGTTRLEGRADRLERRGDGALVLADYKTGQPPSRAKVESGAQPQLPLLAWLVRAALAQGGAQGGAAGVLAPAPSSSPSAERPPLHAEYRRLSGGSSVHPIFTATAAPPDAPMDAGDDLPSLIADKLAAELARRLAESDFPWGRPRPAGPGDGSGSDPWAHLARVFAEDA